MFRTSVEFSHDNISKFSSVEYDTDVFLGTQPWPCCFEVSSVTTVNALSCHFVYLFYVLEKDKSIFSVNTPGYVPRYLYLCIVHLSFVQPFYKYFLQSLNSCLCKQRFFIYF